jgi:molybdopterin-binding protein
MKRQKVKKQRRLSVPQIFEALPTITPAEIIRAPRITRMDTMVSCRRVLRTILKAMAKGEIPSQMGARMAYVANLIAAITKQEMEMRELTRLQEQLAALQGNRPRLLEHEPINHEGE